MKQIHLRRLRRTAAALMIAGLTCGAALPSPLGQAFSLASVAYADAQWVITKYTVNSRSIEKGDSVNITIDLTYSGAADLSRLKIYPNLNSSFNSANLYNKTITPGTDETKVTLYFTSANYSGDGNSFAFKIGVDGESLEDQSIPIRECVPYTAPEPEPEEPLSEPSVQIGRDSIPADLAPGQTFTLNLWVKNLGDADIDSGTLTITPSAGLTVADASPSYAIGRLRDGRSESVPVTLRVLPKPAEENQSITVSFNYRYDDTVNSNPQKASAEQTLLLPLTLPPENSTDPLIQIGRHSQAKAIAKGESQTVTVKVRNLSEFTLDSVLATVTPSAGLMIADNGASYLLGQIPAGGTVLFDVKIKAPEDISSAMQSLDVGLKYNYLKDRATVQGTSSESVPLSAIATPPASPEGTPLAASTPNVIISNYTFGAEEEVMAGSTFDLAIEFRNTSSSKKVGNIVMTITPDENLTIADSSNSFYYPSLSTGAVLSQVIPMQALTSAASAPAKVTVAFSYEYVDNNARQKVDLQQVISIPVQQPDRFVLTQQMADIEAYQYEEATLTLNYINKGKATVYNVAAELVGDMQAESTVQNIGNIESGRSGTIDFMVTPMDPGMSDCKLVITYEDESMNVQKQEFTFHVNTNEMVTEDPSMGGDMPPEEPPANNTGKIIGGIALIAALGGGAFFFLRRRKKKKGEVDSFTFSDPMDAAPLAPEPLTDDTPDPAAEQPLPEPKGEDSNASS